MLNTGVFPSTRKTERRNSSIELLRIVAMLAIVSHHLVVHNVDSLDAVSNQVSRLMISTFFYPSGRIGVGIFIAISAWFAAGRHGGLKSSLRKIWFLNKQMVFYALLYLGVFSLIGQSSISLGSVLKSLFPILFGNWWFPCAFAVYLILAPFVYSGLRSLNKSDHSKLCIVMVILFGVVPYVPGMTLMSQGMSLVAEFISITVLVAYCKWHVSYEAIRKRTGVLIWTIIISFLVIALCSALGNDEIPLISNLANSFYNAVVSGPSCIISLCIVLPALLLSVSVEPWSSRLINQIASLAFGTYLLTDFSLIRPYLWSGMLSLGSLAASGHAFIACGIASVVVFLAACGVELVRLLLYATLIDRHPGKYFDAICSRLVATGDDLAG